MPILEKNFLSPVVPFMSVSKKLEEIGVVKGTKLNVDIKTLGYDVIAFIGIFLEKSSLYDTVAKELRKIPEIVRLNYTTGNYSMFAEVICKDIYNNCALYFTMSCKK